MRAAVDKTPAWEKRDAYTQTEVYWLHWLERTSERCTLYIVLLGAHAGLRVSEMIALKWEDSDLSNRTLKVVAGKGGKTALVNLFPTLVEALLTEPVSHGDAVAVQDKRPPPLPQVRCQHLGL